jgi:hypothetical protein
MKALKKYTVDIEILIEGNYVKKNAFCNQQCSHCHVNGTTAMAAPPGKEAAAVGY